MKRGYGYFDNIRCIEEIDAPDFIKKMRGQIDTMSAYRETDQQYFNYFQEREERTIDYDFRTLAHSVKKSLIRIFPKHEPEILSVDTAEAAHSLVTCSTDQLLISGAQALVKVYLALKFWRDCYYTDQREYAKARFSDMERAVKGFALDVHDMSQMLRGSQGGRATKKPMGIIQAIRELLDKKDYDTMSASSQARNLWEYFRRNHLQDPYITGEYEIIFEKDFCKDGDHAGRLIEKCDEKPKIVHYDRFVKHVTSILKNRSH